MWEGVVAAPTTGGYFFVKFFLLNFYAPENSTTFRNRSHSDHPWCFLPLFCSTFFLHFQHLSPPNLFPTLQGHHLTSVLTTWQVKAWSRPTKPCSCWGRESVASGWARIEQRRPSCCCLKWVLPKEENVPDLPKTWKWIEGVRGTRGGLGVLPKKRKPKYKYVTKSFYGKLFVVEWINLVLKQLKNYRSFNI